MAKFIVFGCILFLFACKPKEETVAFDDLAPTSDYKAPADSASNISRQMDERPDQSTFLRIVDTVLADSRWVKWDTLLFPDRFGPKHTEKWFVTGAADSLVLLKYEFGDSLRTRNAFFNWIDCFGPKCTSYTVGGNLRVLKRNALILVGANRLIVVEGNRKIDEKSVRAILNKDPKKENWMYLITIPKAGKSVWKRIEKGEEKPIIRVDEYS